MEIHVAGRNPDSEVVFRTKELVQQGFDFGRTKIEGELDKTPEQEELIRNVNEAFRAEFMDLGIPQFYTPLHSDSVHFLPSDAFLRVAPNPEGHAYYRDELDAIVIDNGDFEGDMKRTTFTLLHEGGHRWSYKEFIVTQLGEPAPKIAGFRVTSPDTETSFFSAMDEAMCDFSAQTIQHRNFELFFGEGATQEKVQPLIGTYSKERDMLLPIIERISEVKQEEIVKTWVRFCRHFYAGERSVLKDVEIAMGKGYVKYLANLQPNRREHNS